METEAPVVKVRRFSRSKKKPLEAIPEEPTPQVVEQHTVNELPPTPPPSPKHYDADDEADDDDFLADLKATAYQPPAPVQAPDVATGVSIGDRLFAEMGLPPPKPRGRRGKKAPAPAPSDFGDIFGEPTPILGQEKRQLLTKVREFKTLFPEELKTFKVKPNANSEELQQSIDEMETIVNCNGVQKMLDDCVLTAIRAIETVSQRTENFDISGTADALNANPEFHRLARLCYIKYRVFSNVPPEVQLTMIVLSTAMLMRSRNCGRKTISSMLNTPL